MRLCTVPGFPSMFPPWCFLLNVLVFLVGHLPPCLHLAPFLWSLCIGGILLLPSWMTKLANLLLYKHLTILWWRPLGGYTGQPIGKSEGLGKLQAFRLCSGPGFPGWGRRQVEEAALFLGSLCFGAGWQVWGSQVLLVFTHGLSSLHAVSLPTIPSPDGRWQKLPASAGLVSFCWKVWVVPVSRPAYFSHFNSLGKKTKKIWCY